MGPVGDDGAWEVVQRINRAWRDGDPGAAAELFHAEAVMVHPGFGGRAQGREACVESYREFVAQATVHRLEERDAQVDVVGDVAVVTYHFEIGYEMDGKVFVDRGRDLFVLARPPGGGWQVVWRTLVMDA